MGCCRSIALAGALAAGFLAAPAAAQSEDRTLREMLRACARIGEVPARVDCYDKVAAEEPAAAEPAAAFGLLRSDPPPRPRATAAAEADSIEAKVAALVEREPGIHLLTLEDGAQWIFVEGVPRSYNPPARGSTVEIRSASMGSYLLRFDGQRAVRVRRVR